MGLGRRESKQPSLWVTSDELPRSPGHAFYERLNVLLEEMTFAAR